MHLYPKVRSPQMKLTSHSFGIIMIFFCIPAFLTGCESAPEQPRALPPTKYTVVSGERLTLTTELPGRVSAYMVSEVRPQVSGIILERFFEEGADVTAGQILYQIDPALFEAAYNNAKANLAKAEANEVSARLLSERYAKLVKVSAVSRQECDDALAAHRQAKAEVQASREALQTAAINLGYTKVTAPVSGRIGRSYVTPGALVTQNQADPLSTIQQLDSVYVDVTQSNTELLRLRRALVTGHISSGGPESAKVKLKLEDGSPYARISPDNNAQPEWIEGELLFSDVTIDKGTGAVNIRARFPNPAKELLPGMYVRAVVEEGLMDSAVLVPQKAVQRDMRGRSYVYVLSREEDAAEDAYKVDLRYVEIGRNHGNKWHLTSGLEPGELLLLEGHLKARPGSLVSSVYVPAENALSARRASTTKTR